MKNRLLPLILAGAMAASLAGCKSSDPGPDASASTSEVGSVSVSTPEVGSAPAPTPDMEPAPVPEPEAEPALVPEAEGEPAPVPEPEAEPDPTPDMETEPAATPDEGFGPASTPDEEKETGPSLDDLIQLTEQVLGRGGLNYDVSAEEDGIVVSVWMDGFGSALSAAMASGFSVDSDLLANGGEVLVLLERNILQLAGAAGYEDMPVTLRVLDDRNLDQVLFVISDGEITVFEN